VRSCVFVAKNLSAAQDHHPGLVLDNVPIDIPLDLQHELNLDAMILLPEATIPPHAFNSGLTSALIASRQSPSSGRHIS
jgi:hypothetical protein